MKTDLVNYIICPICKGKTELFWVSGQDEIICENNHHFDVVNGVPCMLINTDDKQQETADSFSRKWGDVPDYGYEANTKEFHRNWYLERYGWEKESALYYHLKNNVQNILDAGCGVGRDVEWYEELSVCKVFGVDISESVYEAERRLQELPTVHIIKSDIMNLPFEKETFEFIASDFVLHHTPDTKQALGKLVELLKPGGMISFYVYAKKHEIREAVDDKLRGYTTKMSHEDCMKFSKAVTEFGRALTDINLEFQRMIYWDIMKCFWNPEFTLKHNISVNYDWYSPVYAWRHYPGEVKEWCEELGIEIVHFNEQQSGISVRGIKNKCAE